MVSISTVLILLGAAVGWKVFTSVRGFRSNLDKARRTGLPYIILRMMDTMLLL
jgi:hypothetical protein